MVPSRSSSPPSRPRGVAAITDFSIFSSRPRDWSDTRCGDGVPSKPTQNVAGPAQWRRDGLSGIPGAARGSYPGSASRGQHRRPESAGEAAPAQGGVRLHRWWGRERSHAPRKLPGLRPGDLPSSRGGGRAEDGLAHYRSRHHARAAVSTRARGEHAHVLSARRSSGRAGRWRGRHRLRSLDALRMHDRGGQGRHHWPLLVSGLPRGWPRGHPRGHRARTSRGFFGAGGDHRHPRGRAPRAGRAQWHEGARQPPAVDHAALRLAIPGPAPMAGRLPVRRGDDALSERRAPRRPDGLRGRGRCARTVGGVMARPQVDPRGLERPGRRQGGAHRRRCAACRRRGRGSRRGVESRRAPAGWRGCHSAGIAGSGVGGARTGRGPDGWRHPPRERHRQGALTGRAGGPGGAGLRLWPGRRRRSRRGARHRDPALRPGTNAQAAGLRLDRGAGAVLRRGPGRLAGRFTLMKKDARSFRARAGRRLAALQPESAHAFRHQVPGGVARLALAEDQGAAAAQHATFRGERARGGVEEGHSQVDRDHAESNRNGGADRRAHRHVEQSHHHAAVREAPAVGQLLAQLQRDHRPALLAVPGPGAEQIEEGNLEAEEGVAHGLGHAMQAPPSTAMYCPVMCREASEARKAMVPFRSSSPPSRPRGVAAITDFSIFSSRPRDILEGKKPGQMAFTLMPYLPHSEASARVKLSRAALLVLYAMVVMPEPPPYRPATEEMLTTFPERFGIMQRRPTSWVRKNTAFTLRFITLFQPSAGYSSAGAPQVAPALFTKMSTVPNFASTRSTMLGMVSNFERSPATVSTSYPCLPRWAAASSSSPCLRAVMASFAPISPSASAICKPSPREPPVINATLPSMSKSFFTPMEADPYHGQVARRTHPSSSSGTTSKQLFRAANRTSRSRPRASIMRPTRLEARHSNASAPSCSIWAASAASLSSRALPYRAKRETR